MKKKSDKYEFISAETYWPNQEQFAELFAAAPKKTSTSSPEGSADLRLDYPVR